MRETNFIKQNKEKWAEFEEILENNYSDPEKLNRLFVEITDDLSYSRTFYRNRSVRVYLNNLAQRIFHSIYKTKKEGMSRFWLFWTDELPMLVYQARRDFLLAFLIFFVAISIGALSSAMDIEFPRVILGDSYVDMTNENIESGDPMKVYKQKGALGMSLGITFNNLYVAFLTFVMGVLAAFGTVVIMIKNGIMVGAFQYFFYEKGVFWESFLTIWTHGTLEISAIIIAGAAGITMGKGILFPETYSRMQSFQLSAKRGFKIMLGITPIFIMAGFIEGFFTRYTETPDIIRLLFILICLAFILFYFGWYPRSKAKLGFSSKIKETELPPTKNRVIQYQKIKSVGELFSDVFVFYGKHFKTFFWLAVAGASVFSVFVWLSHNGTLTSVFNKTFLPSSSTKMAHYFSNNKLVLLPFFNVSIFTIFAFIVFQNIKANSPIEEGKPTHLLLYLVKIAVPIGLMQLIMMLGGSLSLLLALVAFPVLILWAFTAFREGSNIMAALGRAVNLVATDFSKVLSLSLALVLLSLLFYNIVNSMIFSLFLDAIAWNFPVEGDSRKHLTIMLSAWSTALVLYLLSFLFFIGIGIMYYSFLEIYEANSLRQQIQFIGNSKRIQGMEREG